MAGTTISSITNTQVKMRWKEPYVSDGLNTKFTGLIPRGIVRGGRMESAGSGNQVVIKGDPYSGDIVVAYEDGNGRMMTVNLGTGDVVLDLASLAADEYYIAMYVNYTTGSDTEAEWRAYTQAQLDVAAEKDEVVIFGWVDRDGTTPIPDDQVDAKQRTSAWMFQPTGQLRPVPVVRNGGFESNFAFWSSSDSAYITIDETEQHSGARSCKFSLGDNTLLLNQSGILNAVNPIPVVPGDYVRVRGWVKADSVPAAATDYMVVILQWDKDLALATTATAMVVYFETGTYDWKLFEVIFQVDGDARFIDGVQFKIDPGTLTGTFWFDDFSVEVLPTDPSQAIKNLLDTPARYLNCAGLSFSYGNDSIPTTPEDKPQFSLGHSYIGSSPGHYGMGFDRDATDDDDPFFSFDTALRIDHQQPATLDPIGKALYRENVPRCWGNVTMDNPPVVNSVFNVESVSRVATGIYQVNFKTRTHAPNSGSYCVNCTVMEHDMASPAIAQAYSLTSSGFAVVVQKWTGSAWEQTDGLVVSFSVFSENQLLGGDTT